MRRKQLPNEKIETIINLLQESTYTIILTGAGMSTDSGIPDFRSPKTGLWNQSEAKLLTKPNAFEEFLEFFWKIGYDIGKKMIKAKPNKGHLIIANWCERGILKAIITQNVDGLHQKAGTASIPVIELHGNADDGKCMFCRGSYTMKRMLRMYKESGNKPPTCIVCAGPIRPNVVLFGEPIPQDALMRALEEIQKADHAILLGSSSVVYPANYLPVLVKKNGGKIVIINNEETELDHIADVVINDSISRVLEAIEKKLTQES